MPKIVIDGNIGAGKTTQLNLLERSGHGVMREPIDQWPLELFYSDPKRWGFLFQMIILDTLKIREDVSIYERCPLSSLKVFWEILEKHPEEDRAYRSYFDKIGWSPDVYIYIATPPEKCLERIRARIQEGDSSISLEYLKTLDDKYMKMFYGLECPRYIVDGTQTQEMIHKNILDIINEVHVEKL